ncbi:hypothetical protein ACJIZ3_009863 [Penstemon smallii]|uniref:ARGOS-like protein n=1 Tax=Penstemon smallii TaxID=265156 RepID=A0ABD3TDQ0_9LAMI
MEQLKSKPKLSRSFINLQNQHLSNIMDVRTTKNGKRVFRYFTIESLCLLVCLTVSLLILPVILPPLPPPPFMLLLLPICILALLMILAFMPTNARDTTYTCN